MHQLVALTPGEQYIGNFNIVNPADATTDFYYKLRIEPFSVNNDNEISLTVNGDYNQMVNWISLSKTNGSVSPNTTEEIRFTIDVPKDAAAGGQYASIVVTSDASPVSDNNINLREVFQSAHLIYADVAGETVRKGNITDVDVPSFLFDGQITASARIHNEGNVHSKATQTMQIYPLFSGEEVFTNEEKPKETWVMPDRSVYSSIKWDDTPSVGIFHVIYNVEYEGVESNVDKIVIICPLWLLFVIVLAIFLIVFKILSGKKKKE
ncbi:hypothetical protein IKF74_01450 [Candidatus Saccharibacteria bacterium]|nr:hypothetical protein [Candidatus Saccharibacteria bacterium]